MFIYHIDAFTAKPFAGNPAAVCLLPHPKVSSWMQSVAAEMNLSETAFLLKHGDGYNLRWFTPLVEVDLCGHATLASAHMLFETGEARRDIPLRFYTKSGLLQAESKDGWIELDFPSTPASEGKAPEGLAEALGVEIVYFGKNDFDFLVEVASEEYVRNLKPDLNALTTFAARGVIVTSRSGSPDFDFLSRFFCPSLGVPEDPVTGSAHCCLGPHWANKLGKKELLGYQASPRGGVVKVCVGHERVYISGQALMIHKAELLV